MSGGPARIGEKGTQVKEKGPMRSKFLHKFRCQPRPATVITDGHCYACGVYANPRWGVLGYSRTCFCEDCAGETEIPDWATQQMHGRRTHAS